MNNQEGMRHFQYPHIAIATLKKLLNDELQIRLQKELTSKSLYEKLCQILPLPPPAFLCSIKGLL